MKLRIGSINIIIGDKPSRKDCATKQKLSQHAAESSVRSLEKKYQVPYDAYECQPCGCWHVGHSNRFFTLKDKYGN